MQTIGTLFLIYIGAALIAYVGTPEDPFSFLLAQVVVFAFGCGSYLLGRFGKTTRLS